MDTMRVRYIQKAFQIWQQEDWILEPLKSCLTISLSIRNPRYELASLYNIFHYYRCRDDAPGMEASLKDLKKAAYEHQMYDLYFRAWNACIGRESGRGNIGVARIQGERMKIEADSLNYPQGAIVADMAIATSMRHGKQHEESLKKFLEITKSDLLTYSQRRLVYLTISDLYFRLKKNDKALEYLDKTMAALHSDEESTDVAKQHQAIPIKFTYCKIYLADANARMLKKYLDSLEEVYDTSWELKDIVSYYTYRGGYYSLINDMPNCYKEFDLASELGKNSDLTYMVTVREMKAECALKHNDYKVAAESFREAARLCYSINRDAAKKNREAIQSNFQIRKALFEQELNRKNLNVTKISAVVLVLLILLAVLWHIIHVNRLMRRSALETHEAWKMVDAANRMKEVFLQKINEDIKEPVKTVVECSAILSSNKNLSQELRLEYSTKIQKHAGQLIRLVNNVLDLSRLEAGMMKFNTQEEDLVQLCTDVRGMLAIHSNNLWTPTFYTQPDKVMAQVDSAWFNRTLAFLLSAPEDCNEKVEVVYTLTVDNGYASIAIDVPSVKTESTSSDERIGQDICRLYLKATGGSFNVKDNHIVITYPIN